MRFYEWKMKWKDHSARHTEVKNFYSKPFVFSKIRIFINLYFQTKIILTFLFLLCLRFESLWELFFVSESLFFLNIGCNISINFWQIILDSRLGFIFPISSSLGSIVQKLNTLWSSLSENSGRLSVDTVFANDDKSRAESVSASLAENYLLYNCSTNHD